MSLLTRFEKSIAERGKTLKVGLVGAGQMGQGIVTQLSKSKGIELSLIIDKNQNQLEKASEKYQNSKVKPKLSQTIESIDEFQLDIVIEATGTPLSGADVAKKVLNRGIHLILLNVETEATIGLALRNEAQKNNCIVTVGDGDEPVAAVELFDFARELSLDIVAIGKGKNNPFNCFATPQELEKEAISKKMNPYMLTSFVDGSKTMIEMAALANFIDFKIDIDGMHGPNATYETLNSIYKPKISGGILDQTGVVDFAFGVAPGVFAVVYSEDEYVNYEMEYLKMGKGPYWTLARPYHLTSLEIPRTIMSLEVNKETRLSATNWNVEVVAFAKEDIQPGTNLGSIGGDLIFGKAIKAENSAGLAPLGISENNIVQKAIKKGSAIELNDLEISDSNLFSYWQKQKDLKNID
tara:strand:- start:268 stop:1494 length:1227 start_codon:yes stop_codon:yes gene_type:complete